MRDPEKWYHSVERTVLEWPLGDDVVLPGHMRRTRQMGRAIIANRVLENFADKDATIAQFNEHIANGQRTVPPSRLRVLRTEGGWEPLCDLLGVIPPIPAQKPWG